jgi:hypothetical protein
LPVDGDQRGDVGDTRGWQHRCWERAAHLSGGLERGCRAASPPHPVPGPAVRRAHPHAGRPRGRRRMCLRTAPHPPVVRFRTVGS